MLMAELEGLEVKPTVISAGPLPGQKKKKAGPRVADKSEDREDGFGKVYLGDAPPPHLMKHHTSGRKQVFDPSTAPKSSGVPVQSKSPPASKPNKHQPPIRQPPSPKASEPAPSADVDDGAPRGTTSSPPKKGVTTCSSLLACACIRFGAAWLCPTPLLLKFVFAVVSDRWCVWIAISSAVLACRDGVAPTSLWRVNLKWECCAGLPGCGFHVPVVACGPLPCLL